MWNSIQAKHPQEAAQLTDRPAVIRYDPSSPAQPRQHPYHATDAHSESPPTQATDPRNPPVATPMEPGQPARSAPPAESPALQSTSARRSIFSRLTGLALLVPHPPQAHGAQHGREPVATSATLRNTDGAPQHVHVTTARGGHATVMQHEAQRLHRAPNQPEVLRRAQAAFADLGEARGRLRAQVVF